MPELDPLFHIAAGVALILFGVRFLRKGLARGMGEDLDIKLGGLLRGRLGTAVAGFVFGTFAPSSTTQSILSLNLLRVGRIPPEHVLSFLLWANAGITVTVQLISLKLSSYYPIFMIVGVVLFQFFKTTKVRAWGQCLISFGLIFMAMSIMGATANKLVSDGDLADIIKISARHPWGMMLLSAACAVGLQSSMAVLGIAFSLAPYGIIPAEGVFAVVIGTNVGIGITTLIAGWGDSRGKALAMAVIWTKVFVAGTAMALLPEYLQVVESRNLPVVVSAAWLHAAVSISAAVLGTVLSPLMKTRLAASSQEQASPVSASSANLDYEILSDHRLALACAAREAARMGTLVKGIFEKSWEPGEDAARTMSEWLGEASRMEEDINSYVGSLSWGQMAKQQKEIAFGIMNYASQLEGVAVTITGPTRESIEHLARAGGEMDREETKDLEKIRDMVAKRLDASTAILASRDPTLAVEFLRNGQNIKTFTINVLKKTYRKMGLGKGHNKTSRYLDLVRSLRRISGQLNTIGHTFAPSNLQLAEDPEIAGGDNV